MYCVVGLMAATLAPSVRISVTGGQETSDVSVNEEKGLRIKNRQPPAAVTDSKCANCHMLPVMSNYQPALG